MSRLFRCTGYLAFVFLPVCVWGFSGKGRSWEQGLVWVDLLQIHLSRSTLWRDSCIKTFWIKSRLEQLERLQGLVSVFSPKSWKCAVQRENLPARQGHVALVSPLSFRELTWKWLIGVLCFWNCNHSGYFIAMIKCSFTNLSVLPSTEMPSTSNGESSKQETMQKTCKNSDIEKWV